MELIGNTLALNRQKEASICTLAFEAHSPSRPMKNFKMGEFVKDTYSEKVLQGLAKISLQPPHYDYHNLSQPEADYILGDLSGDIRLFFQPILEQ